MPAYIEVEQTETPTCDRGDACELNDNAAHHVRVKIGPAILGPIDDLLSRLVELHESAVFSERRHGALGRGTKKFMRFHRLEEPGCSYCAAIVGAERMLVAIRGKNL